MSQVWLVTTFVTIKLYLWKAIYCWACYGMSMYPCGGFPSIRHNKLRCGCWRVLGSSTECLFAIKVFNPLAPTYSSTSLPRCYRQAELEKRWMNVWRTCSGDIEHGSFTPLVLSCSGSMEALATIVYKCFTSLISDESSQTHIMTLYWLRCFSLLRSAISYLFMAFRVFLPSFQVFWFCHWPGLCCESLGIYPIFSE